VIASHSNSRKICPHKRNLSDEQILEIIKRKGLIGLNFYRGFLNSENASEIDILRHTEYILSLGGEDALSIGTDFDGADIIEEFDCDNKLLKLEKLFLDNGFEKQIVDKILFNNANRFFTNFYKDVQI
jgi:membrane dipeptidase